MYIPILEIPAEGFPFDMHDPMRVILFLPICSNHFAILEPTDFLSKRLKKGVVKECRGKVPPDFDRARIVPLAMDSPAFRYWAKSRGLID